MAMKLSATSLDGYGKCPLYFQHRWLEHWREPPFEGSSFGVALHEAAAHWLLDRSYIPNWEELLIAAKVESPSPELIQITQEYWDNWLSHQTETPVPIAVEKEVTVEHPDYGTLTGKIDAIYSLDGTENALWIVDHKFLKRATKKKSNLQMAVYSLLEPRAKKFTYEKVGLFDFQLQEVSSLSSALRNIEKTIYYINKGDFPAAPQPWFKSYCPFLKECGKCLKE